MYSWDDMIQIMKNWIDENIEDIPPLSNIAERLGYSYFYATKKFHEIEGVSFREYISNRKILKAASDLYMTAEKTIDVAIKYGYSSQETFTRAFVRVFGISPVVYRRMQKPTSSAEKSVLSGFAGMVEPKQTQQIRQMNGGKDMKLYVKQMYDWNCYAYYAEDVGEQYWDFFIESLWWQMGNNFIKQYDNVTDFEYCAENFAKFGETAVKQQLKIIQTPWEKALDLFIPEIEKLGVDWYVHGSAAMALWGIDVKPKDVNIIVANYSDFDKIRNHFCKFAITPIQRCDNWVMSGGGQIFMKAAIGIWVHNNELEPYDMSKLGNIVHNGKNIYVSSLDMLKQDNEYYDRPERVKLIQERMTRNI